MAGFHALASAAVRVARAAPRLRCSGGVIISQTAMRSPSVSQTTLMGSPSLAIHVDTPSSAPGVAIGEAVEEASSIEWPRAHLAD